MKKIFGFASWISKYVQRNADTPSIMISRYSTISLEPYKRIGDGGGGGGG